VAAPAGRAAPQCLFCGAAGVVKEPLSETVEHPKRWLPFKVDEGEARVSFRKFARSSIWYPGDLRHARLAFHRLLLPAWVWSARVETHWAALVKAHSPSGKRPVTGTDTDAFQGVLVPASKSMSRAELTALSPFDGTAEMPFEAGRAECAYELGNLTRSIATAEAMRELLRQHEEALRAKEVAVRLHGSSLVHDLAGEPMLLPVFIGAYRRGSKVYRVVLNGQTGKLHGKAPISWLRVAAAVALVAAVLGGIAVCAGGALWAGSSHPAPVHHVKRK
jgi:hypothetical protein